MPQEPLVGPVARGHQPPPPPPPKPPPPEKPDPEELAEEVEADSIEELIAEVMSLSEDTNPAVKPRLKELMSPPYQP